MSDKGPQREPPLRVLGIGGSTRRESKSLILLRSVLRTIEEAGAAVTLSDVRTLDLPIHDGDRPLASYPPALHELLALVREADAFIFCSPAYHGTVSGAVENVLDALDYLHANDPPYLAGKPVALMAIGGGAPPTCATACTTPPAPSTVCPFRRR